MKRYLLLAALCALIAAPPAAALLPVVPGEHAAASGEIAPRLRLPAAKAMATSVQLPDIAEAALERVREANASGGDSKAHQQARRVVIGVVRGTDGETGAPSGPGLAWHAVPGGHVARISIASPRAEALRLAVDLVGAPLDVEMVFFGSADPSRLEGPVRVGDIADRSTPWWTPITEGDAQTIEFFVPYAHAPGRMPLRVVRASHLLTTPSSRFTKRLQEIGKSGSCNVDIACSPRGADPAFRNAAASVAQMVFTDGAFSALCSGTLLNDADASSQVPYLLSADHCFNNTSAPLKTPAQMQAVANSLTTLWGFEAGACSSGTPLPAWSQRSGGATVLHANPQSDAMMLRLHDAPPSGAFYSGWDPNPVSAGAQVVSLHHPMGDLKKVSEGSVAGLAAPGVAGGSHSFIEVTWRSGTTEGGSSGAGLWTPSTSQWLLRGGLWGGSALCTNSAGSDFYSRFDLVYPSVKQYLASSGGGGVDYTDLWWNHGEPGWGLNLIQHPSRVIFGVWYTYDGDGKRTWLVLPSGTWTSSNTYTGSLYATAGPSIAESFDASKVRVAPVGSATLTFSDADTGTFAFTVNGTSGSKSISRQPF